MATSLSLQLEIRQGIYNLSDESKAALDIEIGAIREQVKLSQGAAGNRPSCASMKPVCAVRPLS
jgi:hypothetical protein